MQVPELTTDRLILRAPTLDLYEPMCAFYASERADFVGGQMGAESVWRQLATEIGHWQMLGYGRWTVVERDSGKIAGLVGLWNPEGWPEPEVGWDLFDGFGGKGYATEAGRAARDFAYGVLGWTTLISLVAPKNTASARVAERLGATRETSFTHERFGTVDIWRHPAADERADGGMEAYA